MATDRQTAANRANAAHSTGPRTPEGKAASKYNRLTHGLDSAAPVVPGERAEDWDVHRAGIRDSLAPVGPLEAELADHRAELDRRCARAALLRQLPGLPDDHPLPEPMAGQLLDGVCDDECLTSITDLEVVVDLNLPDEAWDDLIGWDGWTVGTVRAALAAMGKHAERSNAQLLVRVARRLDRETADQQEEVARSEDALSRAEADLGPAVELVQKTSLLPSEATDKVIRYEAHLSRQLAQTLQLLDRAQAVRVGKRGRPPVAEEWGPRPIPPVGWNADSTDRTQTAAERPPGRVPAPPPCPQETSVSVDRTQTVPTSVPVVGAGAVPSVERVAGSADRTQSGSVNSPVVAADRSPLDGWGTVSADRTQSSGPFPSVAGFDPLSGRPDGLVGRTR